MHVTANHDTYSRLLVAHSNLGHWHEACESLGMAARSGHVEMHSFHTVMNQLAIVSLKAVHSNNQTLHESLVSKTAQV